MIHGRYLHIFSLIFDVLMPHQRGVEEAVRAMAPYSTHPFVLQELLDTWGDTVRTGRPDPDVGTIVWKGAVYNARLWEHQKNSRRVCDNRKCTVARRKASPGCKECSDCSLLAYCSPECQEEDWRMNHFEECSVRLESISPIGTGNL
ncbi:hypothetical protein FA13DRAFT_938966 [Coprinellus micaceus]|uniref:MYND-type domain-containing protein n=1 Tax=Coprinellus micaceus TaxID=71717 RepID=A0A4Y7RZA2_COPMI|nr:hypothetical protein FA13DRAFT_938966 [Coprinellus micaceus]